MTLAASLPPRTGEGDRAPHGGGADQPTRRVLDRPDPRAIVARARKLRAELTVPERMLWRQLRQRPDGMKFRRQHPIGPYVVDFCCLARNLVIEVEGVVHGMGDQPARDQRRFQFIEDNGFRVIRVSASRVLADAVGTADAIVARAVRPLHRPADGPPPRAGEA